MATETLTLALGSRTKVKGKELVDEKDDTQIVTIRDGGDLDGKTYTFEFWGKGKPENPGEGPGGDDVFHIDLSEFEEDFTFLVKSMDAGDRFEVSGFDSWSTAGTVHTFTYTGSDGALYTFTIDAQSRNGDPGIDVVQVVCFGAGTEISTPDGPRPVETLARGDAVLCGDGVARPLAWVGRRDVPVAELRAHPELCPVRIRRDAFGPGCPARDTLLSPQHRVLVAGWQVEMLFGARRVLVPAKALVDGVRAEQLGPEAPVSFLHLLVEPHATVLANGLEAETLHLGPAAAGGFGPEARAEVFYLFPQLAGDLGAFGPPCDRVLSGQEGRVLARALAG